MRSARYLSSHLFTPGPGDDSVICHVSAEKESMCGRLAEHPVHQVDRPDIEALAQALATRRWVDEPDGLAEMTEHRAHTYYWACAICRGDLHAIAAAAIEILSAPAPNTEDGTR